MLPRLTMGFIALVAAVAVAACSSTGVGKSISVGPTFAPMTLYATNSTQNAISIFGPKGGNPSYNIGGSSTTLNGPQYLAFDAKNDLWVTQYNAGSHAAQIVEIEALATGNVVPLGAVPMTGRPRGIAIGTKEMVVADVIPTNSLPNQLLLYIVGSQAPYNEIAGANTQLNVPGGVAIDANNNIYVANLQGKSVSKFVLPTPSPTPSGSPTPTPTPSPTPKPTPTGSASPSPTPSPSATPLNLTPTFTIQGSKTGVTLPTSVTVDGKNAIYISDQGNPLGGVRPAILIFAPQSKRGVVDTAPIRKIVGAATLLNAPTDVKVDASGNIYVADSTKSGAGVIYEYAATANGNIAPMQTFTSPGAVTGIGLVP